MAEFYLDCWSKLNKTNYTERDYLLSDELDLCEGCAQFKRVIIRERSLLEAFVYGLHRRSNKKN